MNSDISKKLIQEGDYHIGWYRIYEIAKEFRLGIRTVRYNQKPDDLRVWDGSIMYKDELSPELTETIINMEILDDRITFNHTSLNDHDTMKMFVFKECDLMYLIKTLSSFFENFQASSEPDSNP